MDLDPAVTALVGVLLGSLLGFLGSTLGGILLKRQEMRQQARLEVLRDHLPAVSRQALAFESEPALHEAMNKMYALCVLLGEEERGLTELVDTTLGRHRLAHQKYVAAQNEHEEARARHSAGGPKASELERLDAAAVQGAVAFGDALAALRQKLADDLAKPPSLPNVLAGR